MKTIELNLFIEFEKTFNQKTYSFNKLVFLYESILLNKNVLLNNEMIYFKR